MRGTYAGWRAGRAGLQADLRNVSTRVNVVLLAGAADASRVIGAFGMLARRLPAQVRQVVVTIESPGEVTVETATALAISGRRMATRGLTLALTMGSPPASRGARAILSTIPVAGDGPEATPVEPGADPAKPVVDRGRAAAADRRRTEL